MKASFIESLPLNKPHIVALLFIPGFLAAVPSRAASSDWQVWLDLDAGGEVNDYSSIHVKQSFRAKDDAQDLQTYFTDFSYKYRLTQWLDTAVAYRQQFDKVSRLDWIEENRPYFDITPKWRWGKVSFANRNRIEFRFRESRDDEIRYRSKLTEFFESVIPMGYHLYMSQEAFLDEGEVVFTESSRLRMIVGLRSDPEDRILFLGMPQKEYRSFKSDVYFMYENQEISDDTVHTYVVGLKLGIYF